MDKENCDLAICFAEIVLEDLIRIWKTSTKYRYSAKYLLDKDAKVVAENVKKYVENILDAITNLYPVMPEALINNYQMIKSYLDADGK